MMQEEEDVLDHINHVKALADQLACMEVPVRDDDTVMTLLKSLSYEYLITTLETKTKEELTMDYVTARLMHKVSKRKEKDPRSEDAAMKLRQGKMDTSSLRQGGQGTRTCFYCGKLGHIARFCYKTKNKERENAKIVKDDANFAFTVQHTPQARSMSEWIMDSGATKHMTSHRLAFDIYEVLTSRSVHLGDYSILEAIGIGSIVVEVMVRDKINKIRINECLHVPKLHANLLSVSKLVSSGLKVQFNINECIIRASDGHPVAIAPREGNLYHLHVVKVHGMDAANSVQSNGGDGGLQIWHRHLGHLNEKGVRALRSMVTGIDFTKFLVLRLWFAKHALKANNIGCHFPLNERGEPQSIWKLCTPTYADLFAPHSWAVQSILSPSSTIS